MVSHPFILLWRKNYESSLKAEEYNPDFCIPPVMPEYYGNPSGHHQNISWPPSYPLCDECSFLRLTEWDFKCQIIIGCAWFSLLRNCTYNGKNNFPQIMIYIKGFSDICSLLSSAFVCSFDLMKMFNIFFISYI